MSLLGHWTECAGEDTDTLEMRRPVSCSCAQDPGRPAICSTIQTLSCSQVQGTGFIAQISKLKSGLIPRLQVSPVKSNTVEHTWIYTCQAALKFYRTETPWLKAPAARSDDPSSIPVTLMIERLSSCTLSSDLDTYTIYSCTHTHTQNR